MTPKPSAAINALSFGHGFSAWDGPLSHDSPGNSYDCLHRIVGYEISLPRYAATVNARWEAEVGRLRHIAS